MGNSGTGSPQDGDDGSYSLVRPYVTDPLSLPVAGAPLASAAGAGLPGDPVPGTAAGAAGPPTPAGPPERHAGPRLAGRAAHRTGGRARRRQPPAVAARRRAATATGRGPVLIGAAAATVVIVGTAFLLLSHPLPAAHRAVPLTSKCRKGDCDQAATPVLGAAIPATTVSMAASPRTAAPVPGTVAPATTASAAASPQATAGPSGGPTASAGPSGGQPATPQATGGSGIGHGDTVTVTNPGSQAGTAGTAASLQVWAADSAPGQTLAYSAAGLPAGLSIDPATGLISGTPSTVGTGMVTVTATDGTGASDSAVFTWTISPAPCAVTYTTTSQWAGGFTASIAITAGSSAIDGWTLRFTFPGNQQITNTWNGVESQSGETAAISNQSYNASIAAGGSTSLGFQGTWTASDAAPTSFTVNGLACG